MAEKLNISGRCVLNWFYDSIIPAVVHQGKVIRFREADVMAALEKARHRRITTDGQAISEDTLRLALWLVAPDVAEMPAWLHTRESTPVEEETASRFAVAYYKELQEFETPDEKRQFVQGVIHANHLLHDAS
jgi:hypothetical protein